MKYSELSQFAKSDLSRVLAWLDSTGQSGHSTDKLRQAMSSSSPIIEKHIVNALSDGDYSEATPYTKRLVGWLMIYAEDMQRGVTPLEYSRDRAARLKSESMGLPEDVVSTQQRVILPLELQDWWQELTPEQRGAVVLAGRDKEI